MEVSTCLQRVFAMSLLLVSSVLSAACLDDAKVAGIAAGYPTQPITGVPASLSLDAAYCTQSKLTAALSSRLGKPMGYKVGFSGAKTQQRFAMAGPAYGVLFKPMFVADGTSIQRGFGHRPMIEPDLMVVVKDVAIMEATTELEVAAQLSSVHALIELPAMQFKQGEPISGNAIVAINIGAAKMVMGPGRELEATPEFVEALAQLDAVFSDETGEVLQQASSSALMGNPLRAVLWLVDEMKQRGDSLKAGDRISLGAVGKLFPLKQANKTYHYRLTGLPGGDLSASITVE